MKKQYWIVGCVISLGISFIGTSSRLLKLDVIPWNLVAVTIVYNFLYCLFCWEAHIFLLKQRKKWGIQGSRARRFGMALLAVVAVAACQLIFDRLFSLITDKTLLFQDLPPGKKDEILLFRGFVISGLFFLIVNYLRVLLEKQRHIIEIAQLKQANLEASLSSLKEQLSPHFLFNTLNTLSTLTQEENAKVFISELANVYRYVLQYKEMNTATLKQELTFVESYLYIIKTRLENAIDININIDQDLLSSSIPPLTLQLLIENAVKHNIAATSRKLKINIFNEGKNYLVVQNNFQPRASILTSTGTGLNNVMQRYQLLFGKEMIIEKNTQIFTVKLPVV
ncbi:sensor histidine kinase [Chitinophaga sp. 30R24]|uniref:sensor histidine kinase n=1 Tax=Chitinophaga sp. 30R24 TaxID=3248838 RepID=UPI003B8F2487